MKSKPFFKPRPCQHRHSAGFGITESLAILAIIVALIAIVGANLSKAKSQLALSRVASMFEQNVRRAQAMSLSSPTFALQPVSGYGVYLDISPNNKQYIIYADDAAGDTAGRTAVTTHAAEAAQAFRDAAAGAAVETDDQNHEILSTTESPRNRTSGDLSLSYHRTSFNRS